ncbi:hypothetical protein Ait01nite_026070 [Actinoplanes italicus]|uniref:Uncharacterized protein n=1 Tax=Actinoplanes italicus TaxID=113567 RepID=A0A2T0KFR0_9ACTN|nr:hypothetical protein [Actinoplanes italicus]PRX22018.1 hypothetical protein CLV67_105195 [Actinoplanes italicus]GIE29562.1 hypothetical protein Ait01nite_026070 [Actinoplanes italicus]
MPLHIQRGLALIGVGLLLGFVGLIWVANLFGVADEHAKQISESRVSPLAAGTTGTAEEYRNSEDFKRGFGVGRFLAGGGFMVVGLVFIVTGVVYMISPPAD